MASYIARRKFLVTLGGTVVAWPLAARAQPVVPVMGFLHYGSPNVYAYIAEAARRGLQEAGYFDGQNVTIEYHWAEGRYDRLPALADDLVRRRVNVILAGGSVAAQVAKKATATCQPDWGQDVDLEQFRSGPRTFRARSHISRCWRSKMRPPILRELNNGPVAMKLDRGAAFSAPPWIALSIVAISRTLVAGT
jgi:hypothetical protein